MLRLLILSTFLMASLGQASPVTLGVTSNDWSLDLLLKGTGPITASETHHFTATTGDGYWFYDLTVSEFDRLAHPEVGLLSDEIQVRGTIRHLHQSSLPDCAPEGPGGAMNFEVGAYGIGLYSYIDPVRVSHTSPCRDVTYGLLSPDWSFDDTVRPELYDITGYRLYVNAYHSSPEPATLGLLGLGAIGLAGWKRRQR